MQIRVPIGTNTGWNVRAAGHRAPNLCVLTGSHIPFFETQAEREAAGDPRLSLEERYRNHRGFVRAVRRAASELVGERFLLQEDADRLIQAARDSDILRHHANRGRRGRRFERSTRVESGEVGVGLDPGYARTVGVTLRRGADLITVPGQAGRRSRWPLLAFGIQIAARSRYRLTANSALLRLQRSRLSP